LATYKGLTNEKLKIFKKFYDSNNGILTKSKDDLMIEEKENLQKLFRENINFEQISN
jgi:hypothetical protein